MRSSFRFRRDRAWVPVQSVWRAGDAAAADEMAQELAGRAGELDLLYVNNEQEGDWSGRRIARLFQGQVRRSRRMRLRTTGFWPTSRRVSTHRRTMRIVRCGDGGMKV